MPLIDIKDFSYYYPSDNQPALDKVNLQIGPGEIWAVIGRSGSGKSTLLRALGKLLPEFYGGTMFGEIIFGGRRLRDYKAAEFYCQTGVITQDAEHSIIFERVKRDIAFGLENLGLDNPEMHARIENVLDYLGLKDLQSRPVSSLSGGEKQKTALAGIMAMQPRILILDEPTAQLDASGARDFFELLEKLNRELGMTIILTEQKLEPLFSLAHSIAVLEQGRLIFCGAPCAQISWARENGYPLRPGSFAGARNDGGGVPVKNREAEIAAIKALHFNYHARQPVLKNIDLALQAGKITALTGGNGAGKTTLLKILLGLIKPDRGQVKVLGHAGAGLAPGRLGGQAGYLPQNLDHFFIADTVWADVKLGVKQRDKAGEIARLWLEKLNLIKYLDRDPRTLSAGEKQRAALAAVLAGGPRLILLDEPTRALDVVQKKELGQILGGLAAEGRAILAASHDREFVRAYAHRVLTMAQGRIIKDTDLMEEGKGAV